jgi:hypothetical protein
MTSITDQNVNKAEDWYPDRGEAASICNAMA